MSQPVVYLDLDRTLFQTKNTIEIWQEIERQFPQVSAATEWARAREFNVTVNDLYYYDMVPQLRELGLEQARVFEAILESSLRDGRFEFPGVGELVDTLCSKAELMILTFGPDEYQRFKAALCPSLDEIPIITTLHQKRQYFESMRELGDVWLVDDKPIGDQLPGEVHFIQTQPEGHTMAPADWPQCQNLIDVKEYFVNALH